MIGTTKTTIQKIRERSHWNAPNLKAVDPVTLGLCSQLELDMAVTRTSVKREKAAKRSTDRDEILRPVEDILIHAPQPTPQPDDEMPAHAAATTDDTKPSES